MLANAPQVKGLRGHKTDPEDARWLTHWWRHGIIRPSLIPPKAVRELTRRRRPMVSAGAQPRNRVQKVRESANFKLGNVLSDRFGLSGQKMLQALPAGQASADAVAELAQPQATKKIPQIRSAPGLRRARRTPNSRLAMKGENRGWGTKRAIVAVAHALVTIYKPLSTREPYSKPGANSLPEAQAAKLIRHHTRRLKTLRRFATVRQPAERRSELFGTTRIRVASL